MHDPFTFICDIEFPFFKRKLRNKDGKIISSHSRFVIASIWHVDPEKDGTDDSCGWFMRARHGDQKVLKKIIAEFDFNWDKVFKSENKEYNCGLFCIDGKPNLSVIGIGLNLFWTASYITLGAKKAKKYLNKNIFDILYFCENTCDSLYDSITGKFGIEKRKERIESLASVIYSYILRDIRPWYKHPKFHFWHYQIQIPFLSKLKRFLFSRCYYCKGRFKFNESVYGNSDKDYKWFQIEKNICHSRCSGSNCETFNVCKIESK